MSSDENDRSEECESLKLRVAEKGKNLADVDVATALLEEVSEFIHSVE